MDVPVGGFAIRALLYDNFKPRMTLTIVQIKSRQLLRQEDSRFFLEFIL